MILNIVASLKIVTCCHVLSLFVTKFNIGEQSKEYVCVCLLSLIKRDQNLIKNVFFSNILKTEKCYTSDTGLVTLISGKTSNNKQWHN